MRMKGRSSHGGVGGGSVLTGFVLGAFATASACSCYMWLAHPDLMRRLLEGRRRRPKEGDSDGDDGDGGSSGRPAKSSRSLAVGVVTHRSLLSEMTEHLWHYVRAAGADMIRETVEPSLRSLPGPGSFRFSKLDLGDAPLEMDNVVVHPLNDGVVQMDMDIVWDGRCRIELANAFVTVGVKQIKFSGRMCVLFKPITSEIPIVHCVSYAFVNPPHVSLRYTGLAKLANVKLIDETIKKSIDAGMLSMVLPNRSLFKVVPEVDFLEAYHPPLGVARITLLHGQGFVVERKLLGKDDVPDVYCEVSLGQVTKKTTTVPDDVSPVWNEPLDFCVCDRAQIVTVRAWDEDLGPLDPDDDLGTAEVSVGDILLSGGEVQLKLRDSMDGGFTGASITLRCDMCRWTMDEKVVSSWELSKEQQTAKTTSQTTASDVGSDENLIRGLLVIVIPQAFNVSTRNGASSFVKVSYQDHTFQTMTIEATNGNPHYDAYFDIPLTSSMVERGMEDGEDEDCVMFELMRQEGSGMPLSKQTLQGQSKVRITDVLHSRNRTMTKIVSLEQESGSDGAAVAVRIQLCGVERTSNDATVNLYGSPPASILSPEYNKDTESAPPEDFVRPQATDLGLAVHPSTDSDEQRDDDQKSRFAIRRRTKGRRGDGGDRPPRQHDMNGDQSAATADSSVDTASSTYFTEEAQHNAKRNLRGNAVRVTVGNGTGFRWHETLFGVAMPNLYCRVQIIGSGEDGWLTSTQPETVTPDWSDESRTFDCGGPSDATIADRTIELTVFRETSGQGFLRAHQQRPEADKVIGRAVTTVGDVVKSDGGEAEVELLSDDPGSLSTGAFVRLRCEVVDAE